MKFVLIFQMIILQTHCFLSNLFNLHSECSQLISAIQIVHTGWLESSKRFFECFDYLHFVADADCCTNTFGNVIMAHAHTHAQTNVINVFGVVEEIALKPKVGHGSHNLQSWESERG